MSPLKFSFSKYDLFVEEEFTAKLVLTPVRSKNLLWHSPDSISMTMLLRIVWDFSEIRGRRYV